MRLGQDKIDDCEAANDTLGVHSSLSATQLIVGDDERHGRTYPEVGLCALMLNLVRLTLVYCNFL